MESLRAEQECPWLWSLRRFGAESGMGDRSEGGEGGAAAWEPGLAGGRVGAQVSGQPRMGKPGAARWRGRLARLGQRVAWHGSEWSSGHTMGLANSPGEHFVLHPSRGGGHLVDLGLGHEHAVLGAAWERQGRSLGKASPGGGGSPRFRVTKFKLKHGRRLVPTLARAHLSGSDTASKALRGVGHLRGQSKVGGGAGAGRAGRVMVEL